MASADAMRASDADRERVVQALQEQVGEGRLTLPEFEERSGRAYEAKTVGELRALTDDLPVEPMAPTLAPWQRPVPLPEQPPWAAQRADQRSLPPAHNGAGVGAGAALLVVMLVAQVIVWATVGVFVLYPLVPLLFVMLAMGGRPGRRFH
jgi:hypothetical protein